MTSSNTLKRLLRTLAGRKFELTIVPSFLKTDLTSAFFTKEGGCVCRDGPRLIIDVIGGTTYGAARYSNVGCLLSGPVALEGLTLS